MQLEKIISQVESLYTEKFTSSYWEWVEKSFNVDGESFTLKIPQLINAQGRASTQHKQAEKLFDVYIEMAVSKKLQEITEKKRADLEKFEELNSKLTELQAKEDNYQKLLSDIDEKKSLFNKGIIYWATGLVVILMLFVLTLNFINLKMVFENIFIAAVGSLMFSASIPLFAVLKNKILVKKMLIVVPLDLIVAILMITIPSGEDVAKNWTYVMYALKTVLLGVYAAQFYFVAEQLMRFFQGVPVATEDLPEHYEGVFENIFK